MEWYVWIVDFGCKFGPYVCKIFTKSICYCLGGGGGGGGGKGEGGGSSIQCTEIRGVMIQFIGLGGGDITVQNNRGGGHFTVFPCLPVFTHFLLRFLRIHNIHHNYLIINSKK